jgi:hypothetical protein
VGENARSYITYYSKEEREARLYFCDFEVNDNPQLKVFDFSGFTCAFKRHPNRQWLFGVNSNNSQITVPMAYYLDLFRHNPRLKINSMSCDFGMPAIQNLFKPNKKKGFVEVLEELKKSDKLSSLCLDDKYFVSAFPLEDYPYALFRLDVLVAFYNEKTNVFKLSNEIYLQEVGDFCTRQGVHAFVGG